MRGGGLAKLNFEQRSWQTGWFNLRVRSETFCCYFRLREAISQKQTYLDGLLEVIKSLEGKGFVPGEPAVPAKKEFARAEEDARTKSLEADLSNARKRYELGSRLVANGWLLRVVALVGHFSLISCSGLLLNFVLAGILVGYFSGHLLVICVVVPLIAQFGCCSVLASVDMASYCCNLCRWYPNSRLQD